jgi:hypothetical protein
MASCLSVFSCGVISSGVPLLRFRVPQTLGDQNWGFRWKNSRRVLEVKTFMRPLIGLPVVKHNYIYPAGYQLRC